MLVNLNQIVQFIPLQSIDFDQFVDDGNYFEWASTSIHLRYRIGYGEEFVTLPEKK